MTVRIASLQLLIRPIVVGVGPSTRLLFRPLIEHADFERLPDFVDRGIVAIINRALEARSQHLAWHVADTLCQRFALPTTLVPLETASIDVVSAELTIDATAIELEMSLDLEVARVGSAAASPARAATRPPRCAADVAVDPIDDYVRLDHQEDPHAYDSQPHTCRNSVFRRHGGGAGRLFAAAATGRR